MTTHHAVGIPAESLPDLDRLVGQALAEGRRPLGRRPCRGAILAELIHDAAHPPVPAPQPPAPRAERATYYPGPSSRRGGGGQ